MFVFNQISSISAAHILPVSFLEFLIYENVYVIISNPPSNTFLVPPVFQMHCPLYWLLISIPDLNVSTQEHTDMSHTNTHTCTHKHECTCTHTEVDRYLVNK